MNDHLARVTVQGHGVVIEMVVRGNEMNLLVGEQEFQHAAELAWKVKIIIFCEIDNFTVLLLEQEFDLLCKRHPIAYAGKRNQNQIPCVKVFSEKMLVVLRASVQ
jgi:hypothetical protein